MPHKPQAKAGQLTHPCINRLRLWLARSVGTVLALVGWAVTRHGECKQQVFRKRRCRRPHDGTTARPDLDGLAAERPLRDESDAKRGAAYYLSHEVADSERGDVRVRPVGEAHVTFGNLKRSDPIEGRVPRRNSRKSGT